MVAVLRHARDDFNQREVIVLATYENILQMWESYNIKTVTDLDLKLNSFRVQFAYNTTKNH